MGFSYSQYVNVFHFAVAAILLYVGIQYTRGKKINGFWYTLILVLAFGALGYHGYRFIRSF